MKWWSYLLGYVKITVEGVQPEKLINMAISRGIYLWDITRIGEQTLEVKVRISGFKVMRHIARRNGCRIRITEKYGFPFLSARLKRRKILLAGGIAFCLILYILSSFIWFIDVKGCDKLDPYDVILAAEKAGLKKGVYKKGLDLKGIERTTADQIPQIAWVGIRIEGTRAVIEIAEKVLVPKVDESQPAHVVASKDALIEEILVMKGESLVKEGDTIRQGQVLISGITYPHIQIGEDGKIIDQGSPELVHAKGIVRARVWYSDIGEVPLVEIGEDYTGRTATQVSMKIGSKEIIVRGPRQIPFSYFEQEESVKNIGVWRNLIVPVELITTTYREKEKFRRDFGPAGARQEAEIRARKRLAKVIPEKAKVLHESVQVLHQDEQKVTLKLVIETLEEIGTTQPINITAKPTGKLRR